MARESGELGLYSIPTLPQAFGMAREGSELGLTLLTILPQAFGMARENSRTGSNPGRYRSGIKASGCAVRVRSVIVLRCFGFGKKMPNDFRFCFDFRKGKMY